MIDRLWEYVSRYPWLPLFPAAFKDIEIIQKITRGVIDMTLTFPTRCALAYPVTAGDESIDHCKLDGRVCVEEGSNLACDNREEQDE